MTLPTPQQQAAQIAEQWLSHVVGRYIPERLPVGAWVSAIASALTQREQATREQTLRDVALQLVKDNACGNDNNWAKAERHWSVILTQQAQRQAKRRDGDG